MRLKSRGFDLGCVRYYLALFARSEIKVEVHIVKELVSLVVR